MNRVSLYTAYSYKIHTRFETRIDVCCIEHPQLHTEGIDSLYVDFHVKRYLAIAMKKFIVLGFNGKRYHVPSITLEFAWIHLSTAYF